MNLNQVTVPVSNIERSIGFYEQLGLLLIVRSKDYARFLCSEGNATFSLHTADRPQTGEGVWVYFEIKELDSYVKDLTEKGLFFEEMPNDKPWLWREARLKDSDNNQIILYFAGDNRVNPPWRIN